MPRWIASPTGKVSQSLIRRFCNRIARGPDTRMPVSARSTAAVNCATEHDFLYQTPGQRGRRVDRFACQQQTPRATPADQPGQQRRFDHRRNADTHLRHAELGRACRKPQVAGCRHLQPGAQRPALDAGDRRHRQAAEHIATTMHQGDEVARRGGIQCGHFPDIGATDERLRAGAAQHHRAQCRIVRQPFYRRNQRRHHRAGSAC